jgi:hypothetical protein
MAPPVFLCPPINRGDMKHPLDDIDYILFAVLAGIVAIILLVLIISS